MHTSSNPRWPAALRSDARIALIAPSGPLRGEDDVARADAHVRTNGWVPVRSSHLLDHAGYLAGTDRARLADLQWALDDPTIDAIWCVRGGYGLARLLPNLSFEGFVARPKAVLGYSDVTALHAAIAAKTHTVSFHGPVARATIPPLASASLIAALTQQGQPCGVWPAAIPLSTGGAVGRMAGGNLALLASLCGTPHAMSGAGAIVVLEDVNEAAYRVDRMLRQLEQAGAFTGCVGLAIGQFIDVPADENADAMSVRDVFAELAGRLDVPCLANLPIGHIDAQWTVPLGATATLDTQSLSLTVAVPAGVQPIS